jgi:hypothetical protein
VRTPVAESLLTKPSAGLLAPPPNVGWKAFSVVGKSVDTVSPAM